MSTLIFIVLYLIAATSGNLLILWFGIGYAPLIAFVMIGFDLVSRDILHERWQGKHLWIKMACLILGGSVLTVIVKPSAAGIAIASFTAFLLMGVSDTFVYHMLRNRSQLIRMNGSNIISALIDSISFVWIASSSLLMGLILMQYITKLFGGFIWSIILLGAMKRRRKINHQTIS